MVKQMTAKSMEANRAMNGTFGRVWVNGLLLANVKSFEAKVAATYEEVQIAGDIGTHQKYMGYSGEGTMTLHKIDSNVAKLISDGFKSGSIPDIKIVAKLDDPAAYGAERVELIEVTLDELTVIKFETKAIAEEEVPFKFASYNYLDMI